MWLRGAQKTIFLKVKTLAEPSLYEKIALLAETLPRHTFLFIEVHLHLKSSDGTKLMQKIMFLAPNFKKNTFKEL